MTGPPIDFEHLRSALANPAATNIPEAIRARMQAAIAQHDMEQGSAVRPDVTNTAAIADPTQAMTRHATGVQSAQTQDAGGFAAGASGIAMQLPIAAMRVAHDLTLGITPDPYGSNDPTVQDHITKGMELPIKLASGIATMVIQGAGMIKGLSYVGRVPIAARALEFIPGRLKEIGLGALVNGGIDALRVNGLDRQPDGSINDPSWLDPSAKIARPLAEIGIPDHLAMGIGGAVVGGLIGSVLAGAASGYQKGREGVERLMTPESQASIKEALIRAGVDVGTSADKFALSTTFIKNFRKVALNEDLGSIMADQLTREQFIASEIGLGRAESASPSAIGDMANSGFYIKPDAAVVLPNASSIQTGTVDVMKQAIAKVGPEEFQRQVVAEQARRSADPLAQAAAVEEVGRRIIAPAPLDPVVHAITEQDGRLMAGIFRANPGSVNVVTGITDDHAVLLAQDRLGVKLAVAKIERSPAQVVDDVAQAPKFDLLIGRPVYEYPSFSDPTVYGKLSQKITGTLKSMAKTAATSITAPRTTEAFILADGEPIRGGLNTTAMVDKMRLQKPMIEGVERPDIGLQQASKAIRLDIPEAGKLTVELPSSISKEQFTSLGKAIDTMKFDEVTIKSAGGVEKTFQTPIGAIVQDHIATIIPPKSIGTSITPDMVQQFKRTGVFAGQAVVLPDGTAGEIVHSRGVAGYRIKESLTGQEINVSAKNLTILPTTLQGEMQPSNLFASYMPDNERAALARLRKSISEGWAEPIVKYRDFETFANSRGYMAENGRGGKLTLSKVNEGGAEPIKFKDLKSAVEWVRKDSAPMAELADSEVNKLLGPDRNLGFIGGGGPPPRPNEMMPIDWARQQKTMEQLSKNASPGFFQSVMKPVIPLMRDLDEQYGTQMYKAAANMQTQSVARDNFMNLWYHGEGGVLPKGVKPLGQIIDEAGSKANQELIGNWLEVQKGSAEEAEILKSMTIQERKAAQDLRGWYNAAYPALGVEGPFVEDYMPRYREAIQSGNTSTFQDFMASVTGDPTKVPKGTDWVSDHIREGLLDTYNKDAFQTAVQYLRGGAKNRYMKAAQDEARLMVQQIADKSPNLALPLANMLQAMGGYEFGEQRAMMNETFHAMLDKLPGNGSMSAQRELAEKMTDHLTSAVYASTMGFRPSLALRNAKDVMVMSYPLYGGPRFYEALGRALSVGGKNEAIAARAISEYSGGMLHTTQEELARLPAALRKIQEASTLLYDSADSFTRAATYHAARYKAEDALEKFGKLAVGVNDPAQLKRLQENLIKESAMFYQGDEVAQEFVRRAANNPTDAAQYAGKIAADMTNFLYGRGMQARWMRSMAGRFMGQFGSWSMWYADYLTRMTKTALVSGPYQVEAAKALGRHALVNASILAAGKYVLGVDLSRWASYGALFYSGGPGAQIAMGAATLMRGFGDVSSAGEDPLGQSRVSSGAAMIWNTMPSFVPYLSAGKDVMRMTQAYDDTDLLAASLGTRTTKDYQARRQVDILTGRYDGGPFQSSSPMLQAGLNNAASGKGTQMVDLRTLPSGQQSTPAIGGTARPSPGIAGQSGSGGQTGQPGNVDLRQVSVTVPAGLMFRGQNEAKKSSESKPSGGY